MNIKDIIIGAVCLILCHTAGMAQTASDLPKAVAEPGRFAPLPKADDAFWRDSVPEAMRQSYIGYGEQYLGQPWTTLPLTSFAEFKTNGNRTRYEAACFAKRRQLAALVMAEIAEGKGRFTADIVNGLGSLCEETWWGIPAHYGKRFPVASDQTVDLFNAETAGLIAWTRYMLEAQLEAFAPGFCRHIDDEITRRMLRPAVAKNYWWKKAGMNWNPWICSNWLTCVLICERDSTCRTEAIGQIVKAMGAFTDAYPADGGCDEGTGYWDRAAASLYECIRLLRLATDDRANMMTPKVREMLAYIYKMYIGGGYCVNFADAHDNRMQAQPDIILPIALDTQDPVMLGFAAHIARENNLFTAPAPLYERSGNFPALGRELFMLRDIKAAMAVTPREPQTKDTWLPDLQVMTARRGRFFVAMKGGTNSESHNHNDVGNFIVYAGNSPLIIDAGVGEYTSATFGKDRYSIWTMQSAYHNLPLINGVMQKDGRQYAAKVVSRKAGTLTLDIAGAYPEEAAVAEWKRTVSVKAGGVEVTEDYRLREWREPTRLMLLTTIRPEANGGRITIGNHAITFDASRLSASVEDISDKTDSVIRNMWGAQMYRVVLTTTGQSTAGKITYTIK